MNGGGGGSITNDIELVLVSDPAEAVYARALKVALEAEFLAIPVPADRPEIREVARVEDLPPVESLGPLSVVVLVLPARDFTDAEARAMNRFRRDAGDETRLVPLACDAGRNVPKRPIDDVVAAKLYDVADTVQVKRLSVQLLNLMCLRLAGSRRSLFISYKRNDGLGIAIAVEDGLKARGYKVWRDDSADRDGVPHISPGSPAQQTIEAAISNHGFVLVIDSPQAPTSPWVQEEVSLGYRHTLPLLPVVVDDQVGGVVPHGGRFQQLRELQRDVRYPQASLAGRPLGPAFFDQLEDAMNGLLLKHLRTRRRLLHESARRFAGFAFAWKAIDAQRMLYRADLVRDTDEAPELALRLIVQCVPYESLFEDEVADLGATVRRQAEHFQYGVLVHQAVTYAADKRRLLRRRGGHILLVHTDEIDLLPGFLSVQAVAT